MKIIVAIAFILILGSLGSALFFLMRDKGKSNRTVQALAMRVGFSIALFLLILLAHKLATSSRPGFIEARSCLIGKFFRLRKKPYPGCPGTAFFMLQAA